MLTWYQPVRSSTTSQITNSKSPLFFFRVDGLNRQPEIALTVNARLLDLRGLVRPPMWAMTAFNRMRSYSNHVG